MKLFSALRRGKGASLRDLFADSYYLARYRDVRESGNPAWDHYVRFGMAEDRQPRGDFDPVYYRARHRDEIGVDAPFHHWATVGRARGWRGHPWIDDPSVNDAALMRELFDADFYLQKSPDVARAGTDPFEHFLSHGWKEGRDPAPWFRIDDYLDMNPEVRETGVNPFSHYVLVGRAKGLAPAHARADAPQSAPIDLFQYDLIASEFDADFYLTQLSESDEQPDDPVAHYMNDGAAKGLNPNPWFSTLGYLANNADVQAAGVNPFFHYLCQGIHEGRSYQIEAAPAAPAAAPAPASNAAEMFAEHLAFASPGPDHETLDPAILRSRAPRAKLIAYYLPQFHAIAENDAWWGAGFTEWRNIVRGQPRYRGHQQPRVPEQLGFYDLNDVGVMKRQVELAKTAGLHGFCFYYYNFNGRRILEKPIEAFLGDKSIDFPLALMWANENWTRTWDGMDRSVLLQQEHRREDEPAFLADVARHFADPRYIRIDGRPLFFVYRPGQIPDARERFADWRAHWEKQHGVRPLLFMAQGFNDIDPRPYGLDGAIEFPPHKICQGMRPLNPGLELFDPTFTGHVVSYAETVERSLREPAPEFPLIKTATPSWDNEARRPGRGMTLQGATPAHYERWLRALVAFAEDHPVHGERFVAVNAWNEWAEGAYLEPDVYHGAAYLNATARALSGAPAAPELARHPLVLFGHDAYRHGAQLLVRNLAEATGGQFGFDVHIAVCGDGPLLEDYRRLAKSCVTLQRNDHDEGVNVARRLVGKGVSRAIVNTTVCGWMTPILKDAGFRVASLIHELPALIGEYGLEADAEAIADSADVVIFPAALVRDAFLGVSGPARGEVKVRPQGLYRDDIVPRSPEERKRLRAALDIPLDAKVVINVGYADMRKGFDVFLRAARALCARRKDAYFLWVGEGTPDATRWQMADIAAAGLADRIQLTGYTETVADYYAIADVFFLTSREDPFPSVVMEAFAAGAPIVAAQGVCGTNDLVAAYGRLVGLTDDQGHVDAIEAAFETPAAARAKSTALVRERFRFDDYCFDLVQTVYPDLPKVSVVVPNYNYARYLDARLNSIFRQTHPVFEVIVLDDMSTDESLETMAEVAAAARRKIEIVANETNSGSVFRQWRKGVERARGDYVWIAEADDDCAETFLQTLLARMTRDHANFGFTDSWQVGSYGERLGASYRPYLGEEVPGAFEASFSMDGRDFAGRFLSVKNVILNVSGAVFRRQALLDAMDKVGDDLFGYKVAGDWRLYVELCAQPDAVVAYEASALNGHRRHASSVTHSLNNQKHFAEIRDVQDRAEAFAGPLPAALGVTREAYLKKVAKYLGLDKSQERYKGTWKAI
jgi:glycosyltransferase involved in cell wall biosynthesis